MYNGLSVLSRFSPGVGRKQKRSDMKFSYTELAVHKLPGVQRTYSVQSNV